MDYEIVMYRGVAMLCQRKSPDERWEVMGPIPEMIGRYRAWKSVVKVAMTAAERQRKSRARRKQEQT